VCKKVRGKGIYEQRRGNEWGNGLFVMCKETKGRKKKKKKKRDYKGRRKVLFKWPRERIGGVFGGRLLGRKIK